MKILVIAGGVSAEREVSLLSGAAVLASLAARGHNVTQIDPAETHICELNASEWDIAIPLAHGTGGEDGSLQRELAAAGLKWVGSSAQASALTFNKIDTNRRLNVVEIATPAAEVVRSDSSVTDILQSVKHLGWPVVTKPPEQGSSIGVSVVHSADELPDALATAFQYDSRCMVEQFIAGREVTVAVVDGISLPSIEIQPVSWYDYESKYQDSSTQYVFESSEQSKRHGQIAVSACEACGVTGVSRVDFRVDESGKPWVLEINTIPGMTAHSLVPMAAARIGWSLAGLFERAIATVLHSV